MAEILPAYNKTLPPWILLALAEIGQAEVPGEQNNPRILEYHGTTTLKATADFVPWCSAFVCWVMECAGIPSTRSAAARSWAGWGQTIAKPRIGAIAVMERGTASWMGHVGFLLDADATKVYVLGGNQGDRVSIAAFQKSTVISYRWPVDAPE